MMTNHQSGNIPPLLKTSLEEYISYWQRISTRSIRLIEKIAHPNLRFVDPFNDVSGIDAFEDMLTKALGDLSQFKFKATDRAWGEDGHTAYVRWTVSLIAKGKKKEMILTGVSEITLSPDGKIMSHIDHWDSGTQFYLHLPIVGWIIRKIIAKIGHS